VSHHDAAGLESLRARAALFPEAAFDFVREGLAHTAGEIHGTPAAGGHAGAAAAKVAKAADASPSESRHVSGQQLCLGLRTLAIQKYGLLARTVFRRWGIRRTEDFGVIVYAMIDRGEMRTSENDSLQDFRAVFDFDEAFSPAHACGLSPSAS
jgi:uncharacterized repeat protein (TIGR04138 family)